MKRRALFLVVLVYVTLDLSLPAMPGAFVFDAAQSVETAQHHRARAAADIAVASRQAEDPEPLLPPRVRTVARPVVPSHAPRRIHPTPSRLPRAVVDAAGAVDAPH